MTDDEKLNICALVLEKVTSRYLDEDLALLLDCLRFDEDDDWTNLKENI